jgi:hypothetical protein
MWVNAARVYDLREHGPVEDSMALGCFRIANDLDELEIRLDAWNPQWREAADYYGAVDLRTTRSGRPCLDDPSDAAEGSSMDQEDTQA